MPKLHSFPRLLQASAAAHRDSVFLPRRTGRGGDPVTFGELLAEVRRVAAGLMSRGVGHGQTVGLIAENRYEWILCDQACAYIGAVDVPRGTDTTASELQFLLDHAGCRFAFVETARVAEELAAHRAELPQLETICVMAEPAPTIDGLDCIGLDRLSAEGDALLAAEPDRVDEAAARVGRDDLLTIIYTSGTTADPKGVMLSHGNILSNIEQVEEVLQFDERDIALSVLPAWHSYERIMDYVLLYAGSTLVYSDRRRLKEDLVKVRPTIFVAVPRIWEMLHDGLVAYARKQKGFRGRLLNRVLDACLRIGTAEASLFDRLLHAFASRSLLPKILAAVTGGRVRLAVSGGGALPDHVDRRMLGIGLPLLNGYGLTETSPVLAVRQPETNRPGTIGKLLPRTRCEIRDETGRRLPDSEVGVLWCSGPQIMSGYFHNPELTAKVLVDDWFDTGDLGRFDPDGQLRITGRAKDTIVLAGGENVEPARIETVLKTSPFIEQVVVVGQDRKNLGALLIPSLDVLEQEIPRDQWQEQDGRLEADSVRRLFRSEIDRLLTREQGFRPLERVAAFRVLQEPMTTDNGLLTQTLKVRRHVVVEQLAPVIDSMF